MNYNYLKIIILTQEDNFFLPYNIEKVIKEFHVLGIHIIDSKGSLNNKISDFIKWFGIKQVIKLGNKTIIKKCQSLLDRLFSFKLWNAYTSIKNIALKYGVKYCVFNKINNNEYLSYVRSLNPDLIISYSCPIVIKEPLLKLPKYGIINVHGSFLPYYRGLLPSFWVLYYEEKETGATVHYMNENIDDGDIIIQDKIDISECKTMYEVMNKTKQLGGELMIEAIKKISRTPVTTIKNDTNKGNYFSWPIIEHAKEFHRKGYSLI